MAGGLDHPSLSGRGSGGRSPYDVRAGNMSREALFDALSNRRRRLVLRYLLWNAADDGVDLSAVVSQVAAWENDVPLKEVTAAQRKRVYNALRQTHLPKLEELGMIAVEDSTGRIDADEGLAAAEGYLRYAPRRERNWNRIYWCLAGLAGALLVFRWLGVPGIVGVDALIFTSMIVGLFLLAAGMHGYRLRNPSWPSRGPEPT